MLKIAFCILLVFSAASAKAEDLPIQDLVLKADNNFARRAQVTYSTRELPEVGPDIWDRLEITFSNGLAQISYLYSPESLKHNESIQRDLTFLTWFRESTHTADEAPLKVEYVFNAIRGSLPSRWYLLDQFSRTCTFSDEKLALEMKTEAAKYFVLKNQDLQKKEKAWEIWKAQTKLLDKLDGKSKKLDDYIKKNDRKNTRKLIESYLPWPVMEPFETQMWKGWLDAIEKKATANDSMIIFRGTDYATDLRFTGADGRSGFMSTLLTKNQGSYNRRLRSLAVKRKQNGSYLASQMAKHAENPRGSAFISFTPSIDIAARFIGTYDAAKKRTNGGLLVLRLSKARLFSNGPAGYSYAVEQEYLVPLITFPEDVVYYKELAEADVPPTETYLKDLEKVLSAKEYQEVREIQNLHGYKNAIVSDYFKYFEQNTKRPLSCEGVFMSGSSL
jgi:hypothetical protein